MISVSVLALNNSQRKKKFPFTVLPDLENTYARPIKRNLKTKLTKTKI